MHHSDYPLDKFLFFKQARLVSYLSESITSKNKRMGAVLFKGKSVLSFGCNIINKTHPLHKTAIKSIHAELSCIIKRRHYNGIKGCSIIVYRETVDGKPALAKPCINCENIIKAFGIKKVYYSIPTAPYYEIIKF